MKILHGSVVAGSGVASSNLLPLHEIMANLMGFPSLVQGTLNIMLREEHLVVADATIPREKYNDVEDILLQRCIIRAPGRLRAFIMRPHTHERPGSIGRSRIELMSGKHLRQTLGLADGMAVEVEVDGNDEWWEEI